MRFPLGAPAFSLLLALTGLRAHGVELPAALDGLWVVEDSACNGCDPVRGPEAGALLKLSMRAVQNPFGSDCTAGLDIEILPDETVSELQARFGLPPRWFTLAPRGPHAALTQPAPGQPATTPLAGVAHSFRLSCAGQAAFTLIELPQGDLLMPAEASTVLRFARARPVPAPGSLH